MVYRRMEAEMKQKEQEDLTELMRLKQQENKRSSFMYEKKAEVPSFTSAAERKSRQEEIARLLRDKD